MGYPQFIEGLRAELVRGGFEQKPQLSSSQRFDPSNKTFSPVVGIVGNMNPVLGRQFRKKKHPKRDNILEGGLGEMLMAGAVGFAAGSVMGGVGGSVAEGLLMGGAGGMGAVGGGALDGLLSGGGLMGGLMGGVMGGFGDD